MAAAQLCGHQEIETLRFHAGANFFNTMGDVDILHVCHNGSAKQSPEQARRALRVKPFSIFNPMHHHRSRQGMTK